jgi:Stage II sporulation protein M
VDASSYALVHGVKSTRAALSAWNRQPGAVVGTWVAGSLFAAVALLGAVWLIAVLIPSAHTPLLRRPPLVVGDGADVLRILGHNSLVLALHAMACIAGFIAGSSLPLQAQRHTGTQRVIHEHGGRFAILFVVGATTFSLSAQALVLGISVSRVSAAIYAPPGLLLVGLLPHAVPELTALFLPLAAWIIASRRGEWERLLAATLVTVALAVPVLVVSALWEVYVAPHLLIGLLNYS